MQVFSALIIGNAELDTPINAVTVINRQKKRPVYGTFFLVQDRTKVSPSLF